MNPYFIVIGSAVLFLAAVIWLIMAENRRQRTNLLKEFRESFGQLPARAYTVEDMERISRISRQADREKTGYLDDITWNDLEMDSVFAKMNQTLSAPGEEFLYRILRLPKLKETSSYFKEMIDFFYVNVSAREEMQLMLASVGKKSKYSLGAVVSDLENAPQISAFPHILQAAALAAAVILLPVIPVAAVFGVFVLLVLNAFTYQTGRDRRSAEPYCHLFSSLCKILDAGHRLENITWPQTKETCQKVVQICRNLRGFQRRVFWFAGRQGAGGGLGDLILDYLKLFFHIDLIVYPGLLREARRNQDAFLKLLNAVGEIDAAISVASFRAQLPWYCEPEFLSGEDRQLKAEDMYHPLLKHPVSNSIVTDGSILLTGSNASGKSTFLKAVAVNGILAQTIYTCAAQKFQTVRCQICSSIALRDSIQDGESYFMAEIRSLKRIMDLSRKNIPVLCVIDEVLRGTNTIERIAASSRILKSLASPHVYCFAATHDLELTVILKNYYENYHFEETVEAEDVHFHYKLKKGPSTSRNALKLLEITGYEREIVNSAREAAEVFEKRGIWEILI